MQSNNKREDCMNANVCVFYAISFLYSSYNMHAIIASVIVEQMMEA